MGILSGDGYYQELDDALDDYADGDSRGFIPRPAGSHYRGGDRPQPERWRCLTTGCNPVLDADTAQQHRDETGHRVALWPVRSEAGKAKARKRNRSGYYDKYNTGAKSWHNRLG